MSLLKKIFGKKEPVATDFKAEPPPKSASESRDAYYEDLRAQQQSKAEAMIFGDDNIPKEEIDQMVKKIVQCDPAQNLVVVREGDDDDLVTAEDAIPAGKCFGRDDGRYADIWSTFARINPRILRHFVSRAFIGYPTCTLLGTHEFISPLCSLPGRNAMSAGYQLVCDSSDHKQDDEHLMNEGQWLKKMRKRARKMGIDDACVQLAFYTRLYGIGVAVPRCELKGNHTFEEEYDPSLIKPGSYHGMSVIDPQRFTWDLTSDTLYDPLSPYYMKPEYLRLYNREDTRIHRSWLTVCIYCEVGDDLKGTYMWGGAPLSQFLYERIFCADKLANEIVALAMSKRTVVKDGNMKAMIAEPNKANHFIERWNGYRNNQALAFKEPGETIQQLETSLSDLQPLSAQQYQYAAAIAGVPVTKAMKNVPSGLQATGQYEQDEYDQELEEIRTGYFEPLLTKHFECDIASSYPDRPDLEVSVVFNPLHSPKAQEIQQMASQKSSMVCQLLQTSTITVTEARAILRSGSDETFADIATETPELLKKLEDMKDPEKQQELQLRAQQMQASMGGGMPGMGGGMPGMGGMPGQPPTNPQFEQNKQVFQDALKEVTGEGGGENGSENGGTAGGEQATPQNGEGGEPQGAEVGGEQPQGEGAPPEAPGGEGEQQAQDPAAGEESGQEQNSPAPQQGDLFSQALGGLPNDEEEEQNG